MSDVINKIISSIKNSQELQKLKAVCENSDAQKISAFIISELEVIKIEVDQLVNENAEQKNEIQQLKKLIGDESGFIIKQNVYYTQDGDGPFCPYCCDKRGRKTRVLRESSDDDPLVRHFCRVCGSSYSE